MKTRLTSYATVLLLLASPVFAAEPAKDALPVIPDSTEKKILGHMQEANLQKLQGWPGMIFYCPSEESAIPAVKQICTDAYAKLEALSVQNGVKFNKARNANDVALLPHLTGRLKLLIELTPTEASAQPAAIAARVSVLAHYTNAINRYADLNQDESQTKHPLNVPQHVDAILWETSLVRAGASLDALSKPVADGLAAGLEQFFADYAKANK
ncbi:hypothetical protein [Methylococcus sp. EFPC2]|uniref:hypothetical protein n=1 Tax=Methylococcus sp. EFPC2 TaxID=2812648 RepID=UPI0019675453|nr:hypothetical protein [Methylococcus sp. EFPC2]QSA95485.1 hypothetical protein JWZ97_09450 [Methylococcus sp. EFPC2]